jgi:hypothetical protein
VRIVAGKEIDKGVAGFLDIERLRLFKDVLAVIEENLADILTCDNALPVFIILK